MGCPTSSLEPGEEGKEETPWGGFSYTDPSIFRGPEPREKVGSLCPWKMTCLHLWPYLGLPENEGTYLQGVQSEIVGEMSQGWWRKTAGDQLCLHDDQLGK